MSETCGKTCPDGRPCALVPSHTSYGHECWSGAAVEPAPRRASPAEPEQWDRIDLEHWTPIEPDPDDSIAAFVDVAREALVELRRNTDAFHAVADTLRTLATTLGQRTEQEVQERKLLHSDVAGHYGGHEYRVPRGQS